MSKSLTVNISERLYKRLDRYVRRNGHTKNGLIAALLERFLARPRGLRGSSIQPGHRFWTLVGSLRDRPDVSEDVDAYLYGRRRKA